MRHHEPIARVLWPCSGMASTPSRRVPTAGSAAVLRTRGAGATCRLRAAMTAAPWSIYCHHADATGHGCQTEDIVQAIGLSLNELFAPGDSPPAQTVPQHRGDAALARIAPTPVAALAGTI